MTDIVVTNQAPAAPPASADPPKASAPAAAPPVNGTGASAKVAGETIAPIVPDVPVDAKPADEKKAPEAPASAPTAPSQGAIEMRELARAKRSERLARDEAKKERTAREQIEQQRKADLERVKMADAFDALDAEGALKLLEEKKGLTAQQLTKAAFDKGSPEEIQARLEALAEKKAQEKLDAFKKEQAEAEESRKTEQTKKQNEADRQSAEKDFAAAVQKDAAKYPATARFLGTDALKDYAIQHAWRVYAHAADMTKKHRPDLFEKGESMYSDEECIAALEKFLKPDYDKIIQSNGSSSDASADGSKSAAATSAAATAPTVTSAQATGVSRLPADFKNKSKEEQDRYWGSIAEQHAAARQRR